MVWKATIMVRMYLLPLGVTDKGPNKSVPILSNGACMGILPSGALLDLFGGLFAPHMLKQFPRKDGMESYNQFIVRLRLERKSLKICMTL
jgi:hypothetical protein